MASEAPKKFGRTQTGRQLLQSLAEQYSTDDEETDQNHDHHLRDTEHRGPVEIPQTSSQVELVVPKHKDDPEKPTASGSSRNPQRQSAAVCGSTCHLSVVVFTAVVGIVLLALVLDGGFSSCTTGDTSDVCPVHNCAAVAVFLVLLASVFNVARRPLTKGELQLLAAWLLAVFLLQAVVYRVAEDEVKGSTTVRPSTLDTGLCTYIDNDHNSPALAGGMKAVLEACGIANQYIYVPTYFRAQGIASTQSHCAAGSTSLLELITRDIEPNRLASLLTQFVALGIQLNSETLFLDEPEKCADGSSVAICTMIFPRCSDDCALKLLDRDQSLDKDSNCLAVREACFSSYYGGVLFEKFLPFDGSLFTPFSTLVRQFGLQLPPLLSVFYYLEWCGQSGETTDTNTHLSCFDNTVTNVDAGVFKMTSLELQHQIRVSNRTVMFRSGPPLPDPVGLTGHCSVSARPALLASLGTLKGSAPDAQILARVGMVMLMCVLLFVVLRPLSCQLRLTIRRRRRAAASVDTSHGRSNQADITASHVWRSVSLSSWRLVMKADAIALLSLGAALSAILFWIAAKQSHWLYAALFYTVATVMLYVVLRWPLWYPQLATTRENALHGGKSCLSRLAQRAQLHHFSFGHRRQLVKVIVNELIEWTTQLFNIVTLDHNTDYLVLTALVSVVALNMTVSPIILLWPRNAHTHKVIALCDGLFDIWYMGFTLTARDVSDMDPSYAVVLLVPALAFVNRVKGIADALVGRRFRFLVHGRQGIASAQEQPHMPAGSQTVPASARPTTDQEDEHQQHQRDKERVLRTQTLAVTSSEEQWHPSHSQPVVWMLRLAVLCGFTLLVSTVLRVALQYQHCEDDVGTAVWGATSPQVVFPDGVFASSRCGYEKVTSLAVHDTTVDAYELIASRYISLQNLDVSNCAIGSVLTPLASLQTLDLRHNQVTFIAPAIFQSAALLSVQLDGNPFATTVSWEGQLITELPESFVSAVAPTIQHLYLQGSLLEQVPMEQIQLMTSLRVLDMSRCRLSSWKPSSIGDPPIPALSLWNMSHNQLVSVPSFVQPASWQTPSGVTWDLSYNPLQNVTYNVQTFTGTLVLHGVVFRWETSTLPLTYINPTIFTALGSTVELALSYQQISALPATISLLTHLKRLAVPFNSLYKMESTPEWETLFDGLTALEYLDLYGNGLTTIPRLIHCTSLKDLDVGRNPSLFGTALNVTGLTALRSINIYYSSILAADIIGLLNTTNVTEIPHAV